MSAAEWIVLAALPAATLAVALIALHYQRRSVALQERLDALERERRLEEARAQLIAERRRSDGGEREDSYKCDLRNTGLGFAREISAWITGRPTGDEGGLDENLGVIEVADLGPGEMQPVEIRVARSARLAYNMRFGATWADGAGRDQADLGDVGPPVRLP